MRDLIIAVLIICLAVTGLAWAQTVSPPVANCAIAGAYNATPKTIATGNFGLVQVDVNGRLVIAP